MSKAVLFSIKPKYCELIASGKKTVEVRKTRPKIDTPFKCYIYCTKERELFSYGGGLLGASDQLYRLPTGEIKFGDSIELMCCNDEYSKDNFLNGKVIGEFMCDGIIPISIEYSNPNSRIALKEFPYTCLTDKEIMDYLGNGKTGYGFHISDIVIYDKPKKLREFIRICPEWEKEEITAKCLECEHLYRSPIEHFIECDYEGELPITRPPQSWCYVEELG